MSIDNFCNDEMDNDNIIQTEIDDTTSSKMSEAERGAFNMRQ